MKVRFSQDADAEIESIEARIRVDNPARAITFGRELALSAIAIGDVPFGFGRLGRPADKTLRRKVFKRDVIIYRVRESGVEIVRILHGSRDIERVLASGEP